MMDIRQNYGLGSFVKKVTKKVTKPFTKVASKIVPKEIAGIMRVAAPFLPPGYREAAYLLGTAKQTGRISPMDLALTLAPSANQFFAKDKSMPFFQRKGFFAEQFPKSNSFLFGSPEEINFNEFKGPTKDVIPSASELGGDSFVSKGLGGQNIKTEATTGLFGTGGEKFQFGKDKGIMDQVRGFKDQTKLGNLLLGNDKGGFSKSKLAGIGVGVLSLIQSAKTPEEAGNALVSSTGNSDDYQRGYDMFSMLDTNAFAIPQQFVQQPAASGGLMRTNYAMGTEDMGVVNPFQPKPTGPVLPEEDKPYTPKPTPKMAGIPQDLDLEKAVRDFIEFNGREPRDMQELLDFFDVPAKADAAGGGLMRSNYALGDMAMNQAPSMGMGMGMSSNLGSRPTTEESGLGGLPIEADMRYTGGFMPYGEVEKADDVPARLSKNEFVFTADAVRAAGGGSVQQGAKKMYDAMKKLEQQPEAKGAMA